MSREGADVIGTPAERLVAGTLTIQASIRDLGGSLATVSASYAVHPSFDALAPLAGRVDDVLTLSARGLDPSPANGALVFRRPSARHSTHRF